MKETEGWRKSIDGIFVKLEAYCASHSIASQKESIIQIIKSVAFSEYDRGREDERNLQAKERGKE